MSLSQLEPAALPHSLTHPPRLMASILASDKDERSADIAALELVSSDQLLNDISE